mgnify:CR=1 FL=1
MDNGETYIISFTEDELYLIQELIDIEYEKDNFYKDTLESIARKLVDSTYVDNSNRSKERLKNGI